MKAPKYSYEYLQSVFDPHLPLWKQLTKLPKDCPPWKAMAALEPEYRQYIQTRDRLQYRRKRLLVQIRHQKQRCNPECYNQEGKQISYPRKKNPRLGVLEAQLRLTRRELKTCEKDRPLILWAHLQLIQDELERGSIRSSEASLKRK